MSRVARETVRGLLPPDGLAPWRQPLLPRYAPLRERLRHELAATQLLGLRHSLREWLDGVSDALCMLPPPASGLSPLRHLRQHARADAYRGLRAFASLSLARSGGSDVSTKELQKNVNERNIQYLVHFTRLSNLDGILEHGIYPRSKLEELPHDVTINDAGRWDYHPDSISLSICFPNYLMFYKYRKESGDDWVVLVIHPEYYLAVKVRFL